MADLSKTLEELEKDVWPHNSFPSHLVQESQRLRKVPLNALSVEDLRLLIGQKIGLPFLIPLALVQLSNNPLAEGRYYQGDLLASVLAVPQEFWASHVELNNEMVELGNQVRQTHELLETELLPALAQFRFR